MQGNVYRSLRTGLFGGGWTLVAATASAGPIILGGDDLTDHGSRDAAGTTLFNGWLYIQRALERVNQRSGAPNDASGLV